MRARGRRGGAVTSPKWTIGSAEKPSPAAVAAAVSLSLSLGGSPNGKSGMGSGGRRLRD